MRYYIKFIEYAYLIVAVFFIEETIRTWGDNSKTFLYGALTIMAVFMYFFKRWFRKKTERENLDR